MKDGKFLPKAIVVAFAVETLSVTWGLKMTGLTPLCAVLSFITGIAIAFLLLRVPALHLPVPERKSWNSQTNHYRLVVMGMIVLATWSWCQYWFEEMGLDIANADMLPIIKVMGERFIAGQHSHIYDPIPWIWGGTRPIYLPAMWLPYVPAIAMGIDMRWVAVAGLLFAFGAFVFLYRPHSHPYLSFFTGVLAFLLFWWIVADNTAGIVSVAEEGTVIGYYILLVLALLSGRPWLIGVAISLCVLSRYALAGWIPAYLLWLALEKKWRPLLIITLTGMACFVLLFLVPVGWTTFLRLAKLPGDYVAFAARVWKDSPDVYAGAPAFAWFFGPRRTALLHSCLIVGSFLVPAVFIVYAWWRSRTHHVSNVPVAALKITLVFFYAFIDVPYLYLFYTSSLISLILVAVVLREPDGGAGATSGPVTVGG